ncbi:MAG TPA: hypothetical protein GX398_01420 [Candidatus Cloacimonetes bacterium]|nr:hypothetical protein [Candidatus Cloacimonadota bacterium]
MRFEAYHQLLEEQNRMVNLVSRAEPSEKWWTKHFLDSLLLLKCLDLTGKKALDFGSGAGCRGFRSSLPCRSSGSRSWIALEKKPVPWKR